MPIDDFYIPGYSIKELTLTSDNMGSGTKTLTTIIASISGKMRPLSANESLKYQQINSNVTNRFYCKYNSLITQKQVIFDGNTNNYYEIVGIINPMNQNEFLQIDCQLNNRYASL